MKTVNDKINQVKQLLQELEGEVIITGELHIEEPEVDIRLDEDHSIEHDFPHVLDMVTLLWGYKEIYWYFDQLLINYRPEPRQGFPLSVLEEIYLLKDVHEELVTSPINKDIWAGTRE